MLPTMKAALIFSAHNEFALGREGNLRGKKTPPRQKLGLARLIHGLPQADLSRSTPVKSAVTGNLFLS